MSIKYVDFLVVGDAARARNTVHQALETHKFRVTWTDEWTASAERGSKVANALAGAAAQYFKVGVRIMSAQPGETTIRIERQSSGWMGGAIGAARTTKNMNALQSELGTTFANAGVLRSVHAA